MSTYQVLLYCKTLFSFFIFKKNKKVPGEIYIDTFLETHGRFSW